MSNRVVLKLGVMVTLSLLLSACAATSPERLIDRHDHAGLAMHYAQQAQDFSEQAKHWEFMAEFYEKHPEPDKAAAAEHAAHCRAIAQSYRKAAEEANALASEHRRQRPHGVVQ